MTSVFRYSAHVGYLFLDKPLRERLAAARRHGFSGVEYPAPYGVPAPVMAKWLKDESLSYTQFGLHSGDAERGEKGISIFPERREEFRQSVKAGLDYAEAIDVRMVHSMAGILPAGERTNTHWECYVENLAYAAREAGRRGITVIVEAMSTGAVPDYFIETPDRAAAAIAATGEPNIGLLLDIFHTVSMGLNVDDQIGRHGSLISHVHIADYPGRHEPGSGTLDFAAIGSALAAVGYRGWLGCEYVPAGQTEAGLEWLKSSIGVGRLSEADRSRSGRGFEAQANEDDDASCLRSERSRRGERS